MTNDANKQCDWLDDYLARDLSADRTLDFEEHLDDCSACRLEVEQWDAMSQMLRTATNELEKPSVGLVEEITAEYARRKQLTQRRIVGRTVAAVVAVAAAGLLFAISLIENEQSEPAVGKVENIVASPSKFKKVAQVQGIEFPDEFIGVPIDIDDENVTVVWVYPTVTKEAVQEHFNAE